MASLAYAYRLLKGALEADRVAHDPYTTVHYIRDFAFVPKQGEPPFRMQPDFVVLPNSADEVARIVEIAIDAKLPVVPRGAGSTGYGGAVPCRGGILVDFRLMNRLLEVNAADRTVTVQPGVTWKELNLQLAPKGLWFPAYPTFAPSSTIGGWIAHGGVGIGSFKYGTARDAVHDLEIVRPDGERMRTGHPGLDLAGTEGSLNAYFAGSEGTLGLVTEATLAVRPLPPEVRPLAYAFATIDEGFVALRALLDSDLVPYHIAAVDRYHLAFLEAIGRAQPEAALILLVALDGERADLDAEEKDLDALGKASAKLPVAAAREWWTERLYPLRARRISGGLIAAEVEVPMARLYDAMRGVRLIGQKLKGQVATTWSAVDRGSAAVTPYLLTDERTLRGMLATSFVQEVAELSIGLGGHPMGLGLLMAHNLERMHRGGGEVMRRMKATVDPGGSINPGKLVETGSKYSFPLPDNLPAPVTRFMLKTFGRLRSLAPREKFVSMSRRP